MTVFPWTAQSICGLRSVPSGALVLTVATVIVSRRSGVFCLRPAAFLRLPPLVSLGYDSQQALPVRGKIV